MHQPVRGRLQPDARHPRQPQLTQQVAMVQYPARRQARIRHVELVKVADSLLLVVLIYIGTEIVLFLLAQPALLLGPAAAAITGAGTEWRMASSTVHRPSPESSV